MNNVPTGSASDDRFERLDDDGRRLVELVADGLAEGWLTEPERSTVLELAGEVETSELVAFVERLQPAA